MEDEIYTEACNHIKFTQLKVKAFVDVETTHEPAERIASFLEMEAGEYPPLVLWGNSGSGKTSLLAVAAVQAAKTHKDAFVIVRFLGTTAHSYSATALLTNLCLHIQRLYELPSEAPPAAYYELINHFESLLKSLPVEKPLILFLDSLDQLEDGKTIRTKTIQHNSTQHNKTQRSSTKPNAATRYSAARCNASHRIASMQCNAALAAGIIRREL